MERFATEVLESKISLTKSKCDSLRAAQRDLLTCIASLSTRLDNITESTKPAEGQEPAVQTLRLLKKRLVNTIISLDESLRRLTLLDQRMQDARSGSVENAVD